MLIHFNVLGDGESGFRSFIQLVDQRLDLIHLVVFAVVDRRLQYFGENDGSFAIFFTQQADLTLNAIEQLAE